AFQLPKFRSAAGCLPPRRMRLPQCPSIVGFAFLSERRRYAPRLGRVAVPEQTNVRWAGRLLLPGDRLPGAEQKNATKREEQNTLRPDTLIPSPQLSTKPGQVHLTPVARFVVPGYGSVSADSSGISRLVRGRCGVPGLSCQTAVAGGVPLPEMSGGGS